MSVHELVIVADPNDDPRVELRCHAAPDAPCRRRPPDWETRDGGWTDEESTEPGHPCWAVEWLDAAGPDALRYDGPQSIDLPGVPVIITYDECVTWTPADPEATLPMPEDTTDAEIQAAAEAIARCTFPDKGWWELSPWKREYNTKRARAALDAARKAARHE